MKKFRMFLRASLYMTIVGATAVGCAGGGGGGGGGGGDNVTITGQVSKVVAVKFEPAKTISLSTWSYKDDKWNKNEVGTFATTTTPGVGGFSFKANVSDYMVLATTQAMENDLSAVIDKAPQKDKTGTFYINPLSNYVVSQIDSAGTTTVENGYTAGMKKIKDNLGLSTVNGKPTSVTDGKLDSDGSIVGDFVVALWQQQGGSLDVGSAVSRNLGIDNQQVLIRLAAAYGKRKGFNIINTTNAVKSFESATTMSSGYDVVKDNFKQVINALQAAGTNTLAQSGDLIGKVQANALAFAMAEAYNSSLLGYTIPATTSNTATVITNIRGLLEAADLSSDAANTKTFVTLFTGVHEAGLNDNQTNELFSVGVRNAVINGYATMGATSTLANAKADFGDILINTVESPRLRNIAKENKLNELATSGSLANIVRNIRTANSAKTLTYIPTMPSN